MKLALKLAILFGSGRYDRCAFDLSTVEEIRSCSRE
jgi:hypothetical protein